jgi:hypothetical protein
MRPIVPEPNHMQPHLMGSLVVALAVAPEDAFQVQVAVLQPLHTCVTVAVCPYAHPFNKGHKKRAAAQKVCKKKMYCRKTKEWQPWYASRVKPHSQHRTICADRLKPRGSKGFRSNTRCCKEIFGTAPSSCSGRHKQSTLPVSCPPLQTSAPALHKQQHREMNTPATAHPDQTGVYTQRARES